MVVGNGPFTYTFEANWAKLPLWWRFRSCSDVAIDSKDRVFVLDRGTHPVIVLDTDGNFLSCWGEGLFRFGHSIYLDRNDFVWTSDCHTQLVMKFTQDGQLLQTIGNKDVPGTTYYGIPFNMPTGVAVSPSGFIYVADGYGNYKVHKYSPEGVHLGSWGSPGTGPGQFALVHYLDVDDQNNVYVCDRENGRIQVFDENGKYLSEWRGLNEPSKILVRGNTAYVVEQGVPLRSGRVSIFSLDGKLLSRWANDEEGGKGTLEPFPHGISVDSRGDVYVAELDPSLYDAFRGEWAKYFPPDLPEAKPGIVKFIHAT
jgi:DNA-binding beta-propeller fold protein YncE